MGTQAVLACGMVSWGRVTKPAQLDARLVSLPGAASEHGTGVLWSWMVVTHEEHVVRIVAYGGCVILLSNWAHFRQ